MCWQICNHFLTLSPTLCNCSQLSPVFKFDPVISDIFPSPSKSATYASYGNFKKWSRLAASSEEKARPDGHRQYRGKPTHTQGRENSLNTWKQKRKFDNQLECFSDAKQLLLQLIWLLFGDCDKLWHWQEGLANVAAIQPVCWTPLPFKDRYTKCPVE